AAVAHCARGGTRTPPAVRARGDRARRARVRRAARDRARALVGVRGRGLVLRADALDERVLDLFVLARDLAALRTLGEVGDRGVTLAREQQVGEGRADHDAEARE